MTQTLILTRHAKSDWAAGLEDFERPLNRRGRMSAPTIAKWLVDAGYLPDVVLVSGARRTVETWERMADAMPETATMESVPALYHASADTILRVLRSQTAPTVMTIGHNPGIGAFARRIVVEPPDHPRFSDYPTAATAVIRFSAASWRDIDWGTGEVLDFAVPRDLSDRESD
jgi:phosphohistidine phosphatase